MVICNKFPLYRVEIDDDDDDVNVDVVTVEVVRLETREVAPLKTVVFKTGLYVLKFAFIDKAKIPKPF
ncbi:hypothetical protein LNQ81_12365 [Myroides sp. M-43]|uniref:hypothetical protein n=1 Tax=Myroides oncorhynchi TaxID=2893756 RepID=UPI001E50086D|nr:hypothetical protein [Myroides oncorhynchi]MCC9043465.1 hypothetical protein [Myroides oncorhynchi]